jgi:hypothetical protein
MYQWLRKRLGVIGCMHRLDDCDIRLLALEKLAEGGTYEDYKKSKVHHVGAQRYDEIERDRSRRKKDHSLHGGYVPHD